VTSRLSTQADFQKGVSPSTGVNRSYDLRTTYGASARYQFGSRLSAGIEGRYSELDANGALLPSAVTLTHSETSTYGADIRYAISRRIALRLEGQHQKRTASLSSYNYSSDQIGLTASVKF